MNCWISGSLCYQFWVSETYWKCVSDVAHLNTWNNLSCDDFDKTKSNYRDLC